MKRLLIAALALLPTFTLAAGNDLFINQRNPDNTATLTRTVTKPAGTADGVFGFNGASQLPVFLTMGPGLTLSGGVLDAAPASVAWASVTGKPAFAPVALTGAYSALTGIPATFAPAAHTQPWSTITATPTTLAGYSITDALPRPTGSTAQYVRGDGSLATLPVARRIEVYSGTTNAAGQIVVTYGSAYPAAPVVQPPAPTLANQIWTTVSSTATGFTLQLNQRNTVTLLSTEVLLGATVPVAGVTATVLVVAQ